MKFLFALLLPFLFSINSIAMVIAKKPLFEANGTELFKVQNAKGKTPEFRILDDNATESALAFAAIAFINSHQEVQPKVPVKDYIDLKFESIELVAKTKVDIEVVVKLSGYEIVLDRTIKKDKLLSGEPIELNYAPREKDLSLYTIKSSGKLRIQLDKKSDNLLLHDVHGKISYETGFGGSGEEDIRFTGKGIRQ